MFLNSTTNYTQFQNNKSKHQSGNTKQADRLYCTVKRNRQHKNGRFDTTFVIISNDARVLCRNVYFSVIRVSCKCTVKSIKMLCVATLLLIFVTRLRFPKSVSRVTVLNILQTSCSAFSTDRHALLAAKCIVITWQKLCFFYDIIFIADFTGLHLVLENIL